MSDVNYPFIKKWLEHGAPDIDALSSMLGLYSLNVVRAVQGEIAADSITKSRFASAFNCRKEEIFPEDSSEID